MTEEQIEKAKSALKAVIKKIGSQEKLACAIKTNQQNVSYWLKTGMVNPKYVSKIVEIDVCEYKDHDFRPDVFSSKEAA